MRASSARSLAIGAVAGSAVIAGAAEVIRTGRPPRARLAFGALFAGVALVSLAGVAPQLVGALAVVVILSTVLTTGYGLLAPVRKLID